MIKEKNITICAILFVVFQLVGIVLYLTIGYYGLSWILESLLVVALAIVLDISYKSHTKDVMKPLIGATLILMTDYELVWAGEYI